MDAVLPGFVRSGGYHATPISGKPAHNDGFAPVLRVIELFYLCVKRVQIRVRKTGHGKPKQKRA